MSAWNHGDPALPGRASGQMVEIIEMVDTLAKNSNLFGDPD
jgi:hypothetical protein